VTALVLARFPIVVALAALGTGGLTLLTVAVVGLAILATAPFYGLILGIVREQAAEQHIASRDIADH